MRILIIDDNIERQTSLLADFKAENYQVDLATTLDKSSYFLDIRYYNVVVVSEALFAVDNDVLAEIKNSYEQAIVIVIDDKTDAEPEVAALKAGVDDYIGAPFHFSVLLARMDSRLGLMNRWRNQGIITIEDLTINLNEQKAYYAGELIDLRGKPFEVFQHLACYAQQILAKDQLLDAIWEDPELVTPNVIDVAVSQIRKKVDERFGITTIETIRRLGYRFCFTGEEASI